MNIWPRPWFQCRVFSVYGTYFNVTLYCLDSRVEPSGNYCLVSLSCSMLCLFQYIMAPLFTLSPHHIDEGPRLLQFFCYAVHHSLYTKCLVITVCLSNVLSSCSCVQITVQYQALDHQCQWKFVFVLCTDHTFDSIDNIACPCIHITFQDYELRIVSNINISFNGNVCIIIVYHIISTGCW